MGVEGAGRIWEIPVSSSQYCCEPITALKIIFNSSTTTNNKSALMK